MNAKTSKMNANSKSKTSDTKNSVKNIKASKTAQMPQAWTLVGRSTGGSSVGSSSSSTSKVSAQGKGRIEARINMDHDHAGQGVCPACTEKMEGPVLAGAHPVLVCWSCRTVLPLKDEDLQREDVQLLIKTGVAV